MAEGQAMVRKEERSTGKVTSFKKSFGFIKPDDGGEDLFVHQSEIRSDGGYRTLSEGDIVEFTVALSDNKYQAINVTAPGGVPLGSSRRPGFASSFGNRRTNNGGGCYNCGSQGHLARDCNSGGGGNGGACFNCGDSGHFARECPRSSNAGGDFGGGGSCYRCGGHGHLARDCASGGNSGCYNCGGFGHLARDCTSARTGGRFSGGSGGGGGGGAKGCFNCGKDGHFARECPNLA